ncbi:MAG TPA: transglutaminase domain-containing protein [Bacteroidales bacterium]|nr:transglutaminase domain-containing protein [Bacteroidales bacterium]HRZ76010.1 transglutaminase domain-containing protein [Bacteroidales bacterium]
MLSRPFDRKLALAGIPPALFFFLSLFLGGLPSCKPQPHFISDAGYRDLVEQRFHARQQLAHHREDALFGVFDRTLTREERQALKFLYAFMPLSDLADYDGAFYLDIVRTSFAIRDTFPWGRRVPEELFRHFVLPCRVNNENLDSSRRVFFRELKERVKNLDMKSAALEVNHWCHEKVTYQGSDERTSSPLATVRTALGRCGEESVFTVSALRAVGIPARQVYTPRWAHTDDNHAWVEFWADGEWYFMGACEPAPEANMGWFTEPARRAMLVSTQTYGPWKGPGRVLEHRRHTSVLNTLEVYAEVRDLLVKVLGPDGRPVPGARVEFQLYNYAEFYPIAVQRTDAQGRAAFSTGKGDLMVWASAQGLQAWEKAPGDLSDTLVLRLGSSLPMDTVLSLDLVPPLEPAPRPIAEQGKALNDIRWKREDSLRAAYEATFIRDEESRALAVRHDLDTALTVRLLRQSRGNWPTVKDFMVRAGAGGFPLLLQLSEKDLRDIRPEALADHFDHRDQKGRPDMPAGSEAHQAFVLNPRVANEMLRPYREYFKKNAAPLSGRSPGELADWVKDSIKVLPDENFYRAPISPVGVYGLRCSDPWSLRIFYVALCRSFGIPARLEPGTRYAQYWDGEWQTVKLEGEEAEEGEEQGGEKARLVLFGAEGASIEPLYSLHFTLARLQDSSFRTLDYAWEQALKDFSPQGLALDPGLYRLTTGVRRGDGSVMAAVSHFSLEAGLERRQEVTLRRNTLKAEPLAVLPSVGLQLRTGSGPLRLDEPGRVPALIVWIAPGTEPTRHLLMDLQTRAADLQSFGMRVYMVSVEGDPSLAPTAFPAGFSAEDKGLVLLKALENAAGRELRGHWPVVALATAQRELQLYSAGYRIGTVEGILGSGK